MNQNQEDLTLIINACRAAGAILLKYFGTDLDVERKAESGNSPVTIADKETDAFLQEALLKARPNYGWLSEEIENDMSHLSANRAFVVDPIDGTKPFIKGIPEFAISVAVIENSQPVVGVVFNPVKNEMFTSVLGEGVELNGQPIKLNESDVLEHFLGSVGESKKGYLDPYESLWEIHKIGSIAYKMALVAAGKGDLMATFRPKSEWDIAAGHLMCQEMGFKVADFEGQIPRYDARVAEDFVSNLLVAPEGQFDDVLAKILSLRS